MGITVKNGTPTHHDSLCETCSNAHIERGFRMGEKRVHCRGTYFAHVVSFPVCECTGYVEKKRQTLWEMEKIAWVLSPSRSKRTSGFVPADGGGDEDVAMEWTQDDED